MREKVEEFLRVAEELSELKKCLSDIGMFPFLLERTEGKVLEKINQLKDKLPTLNKKEQEELFTKHKYKLIKFGICVCNSNLRKLSKEIYCRNCDRLYYEEN